MEDKNNIQVVVRVRPPRNGDFNNSMVVNSSDQSINIGQGKDSKIFTFDRVFPENTTQEQIYDEIGRNSVSDVLKGYNSTIMVYGQTGSGKTYTITGGSDVTYRRRGLAPRIINHIFEETNKRTDCKITVRMSYLEIYQNKFSDLLKQLPADELGHSLAELYGNGEDLHVVDDGTGTTKVVGLSCPVAESEEEALHYLFEGETNRSIADHAMNKNSSRSHCIITLYLEIHSRVESSANVIQSKLHLVDLAGSERVKKTGAEGLVLNEAKYINQSLSFLEQVIVALTTKSREHVPYRQTKLTNVLRDSLGGNCKTTLVANVSPESVHSDETTSTLRFASRARRIENSYRQNIILDPQLLIKQQEKEIALLKQELSMYDLLNNRETTVEPLSASELRELRENVCSYVNGETDINVASLRQIQAVFGIFKEMLLDNNFQLKASAREQNDNVENNVMIQPEEEEDDAVGSDDDTHGFGTTLGTVASGSRPANATLFNLAKEDKMAKGNMSVASPSRMSVNMSISPTFDHKRTQMTSQLNNNEPIQTFNDGTTAVVGKSAFETVGSAEKEEYYERYLSTSAGRELKGILDEKKTNVNEIVRNIEELVSNVNESKKIIDSIKNELNSYRLLKEDDSLPDIKTSDAVVVDETEINLLNSLKDNKKNYKRSYNELVEQKKALKFEKQNVSLQRQKLLNAFDRWFALKIQEKRLVKSGQNIENMDTSELFDQLEQQKVISQNPESLAFFNARKQHQQTINVRKINKQRNTKN
eukprot:TRINITY_DN2588_c0_g1_i1.p1 TRINITY_DN2588_c0_g1~~TRINITY_DN2588_c0_g1_i1.p1  ORF type:complete len:776 (+),score=256.75 TRINITY_DN2588_c0_g1_i1:41-2329(+)